MGHDGAADAVADDDGDDEEDGGEDQHDGGKRREHRPDDEAGGRSGGHYLAVIGRENCISAVRPASIVTRWLLSPMRSCQAVTE